MIEALMETRGVRHALLVNAQGEIVTAAGPRGPEADADLNLVAAGRAVIASLQATQGSGEWNDLLLDVDGGPVLLTPVGDQILLAAFDDVASLGRIRFAVRRLLGQI
ncbi:MULTISPECIES: roadblock/LC7 domain-containing protein [Deinococcus]|uniref:Roadblock/LAMTOR2 domain-containing protein n=1 Tax=Deinococcus puniceus TaxID=1182568 RepID=A0A172T9Y9_9DEIO|nr:MULTISPECIES: roadblock/LC7 domain-containing protein [Deinococcus]ANE43747.1 hypothetical protein SU48_08160 [Deinococcus puniceus]UQN06196.1 roadblock/LC7 domain-containing protein [Deinococcus sp. QL22]